MKKQKKKKVVHCSFYSWFGVKLFDHKNTYNRKLFDP